MLESFLKRLKNIGMASEKLYRNTLKELFQVKNGLTESFLFFFWNMPKIWEGRTTLNEEKKEDGLI